MELFRIIKLARLRSTRLRVFNTFMIYIYATSVVFYGDPLNVFATPYADKLT